MKDKAGRELGRGDLVIYGVAYGRCAGLSYGKVLEITEKDKAKVHGVDAPWKPSEVRVNSKAGFLQFSERVLIVDREQIPANILAKLDKIEPVYEPPCTCEAYYCGHARECPHYNKEAPNGQKQGSKEDDEED